MSHTVQFTFFTNGGPLILKSFYCNYTYAHFYKSYNNNNKKRERFTVDVACMDEKKMHTKYATGNLREREDFVKPTSTWKHNLILHRSVKAFGMKSFCSGQSTGVCYVNTARSLDRIASNSWITVGTELDTK
jgi:hypothetical protein